MSLVHLLVLGINLAGKVFLPRLLKAVFDQLMQRALVAFQGQDIVTLACDDRFGNVLLSAHGVDGHGGFPHVQHPEDFRQFLDFVAFAIHFALGKHDAGFPPKKVLALLDTFSGPGIGWRKH